MRRSLVWLLAVWLWIPPGEGASLAASYTTGGEVPLTADGFVATGMEVEFTLNFAPGVGTSLLVVNNTGLDFIEGTFDDLPNGAEVELLHAGVTHRFVAWYYGGDGNDLVLLWPYTNLAAWGLNLEGQLGNRSTTDRRVPTAVDQSSALVGRTIVQVARGTSHSLALTSEGRVYAWGRNAEGQLGDDSTVRRTSPVAVNTQAGVSALADKVVVAVAAGREHSLALCSDGTVAAWGLNSDGRLGNGTVIQARTPVLVSTAGASALAGKKVVRVSAGRQHSVALTSEGQLVAWGANSFGQVGDGTADQRVIPVAVSRQEGRSALFGRRVVTMASGRYHNLAVCTDGSVVSWGANDEGRLGDGTLQVRNVPVAVSTELGTSALFGRTVVGVAAGAFHSLAVCSDGTVAAWGANTFGQLGDNSATDRLRPVQVLPTGVLAGKQALAGAGGLYHSLALNSDGTLAAWGSNLFGQLGDNTQTERRAPVAVNVGPSSVLAGRMTSSLAGSGAEAGHSLAIFSVAESDFDIEPKPDIALEEPVGTALQDGAVRDFGVAEVGGEVRLVFTIRNLGEAALTGLGITLSGPAASQFRVAVNPQSPLAGPAGSTTFTVRFGPSSTGSKSATLHIASNDPDENPFNIALRGLALSSTEDFDGDGLSDWSEARLAALGFDWQVKQDEMVGTLLANADLIGLYNQEQYDANREAGRDDILNNPNAAGLYDQAQYDANREAGRNDIRNNPNAAGLFTLQQVEASRAAGRAEVVADPNAYGLYDQAQYDANRQGREDVLNDPNAYGLYDQDQYEANWEAGRDWVLADPNAYQLFTFTQVDVLTVGAPLLQRDPATGEFSLLLDLQMSTDLLRYSPFHFEEGAASVGADGKVRLRFAGPTGTAFFRVLVR